MKTIVEKRDGQYDREAVNGWLDASLKMLPNGRFAVSIEREREPRSLNQNALMWLWFTGMARMLTEYTGTIYNKDEVHDHYVSKFLYKADKLQPGAYIVRGTARLTKEEMTEFLTAVQADAATEYGITLPSPDDVSFAVFQSLYGAK